MAGGWDPSLVDPTDVVFDGLILRSVGGRTGEVTLENGQQIRFPFKAQQEITSSVPPTIKTEEVGGANHYLHSTYSGGSFPTVHDRGPFLRFISGFPDDASPSSVADLASGQVTGQSEALIRLTSSPTTGEIYVFGNTSFVDSVNLAVISTLGTISITAGDDITISTTGAGDTILIDSADALTLNSAGLMTIQPDVNQNLALTTTGTGDITISANGDASLGAIRTLALSAGSGFDLTIGTSGVGIVDIANAGTVRLGNGSSVITIGGTTSTINLAGYQISGAWTDYTPTLSQNGTVTKTVTYCRYRRYGRTVVYQGYIVATAAGTAGQVISVSLPVTAAIASFHPVGTFYFYDASTATNYAGTSLNRSTTSLGFLVNQAGEVGNNPSFALAADDQIKWEVVYEADAS